ncbi:MAG: hypothetical protein L7H08_04955 [Vulcanisaeta sp.]|nr:hypothetical protein [Vulcanisaeta sp.]
MVSDVVIGNDCTRCIVRACFKMDKDKCIDERYLRIPYLYLCDNNEYNHYTKKIIDCEIMQSKQCCENTPRQADCFGIFKENNILVVLEVTGRLDEGSLQKDCSCNLINNYRNYNKKKVIIYTTSHPTFPLYLHQNPKEEELLKRYDCKLSDKNIDISDLCGPDKILNLIQRIKSDCVVFSLNLNK